MQLGIKSLNRSEMTRILKKDFKSIEVISDNFVGMIGLLKFIKVTDPLYVSSPIGKDICIANENYKWLQFAPKNSNWWLTVMYDENDEIIESYFDITKENIFENDNPYFIDMKLDVVIPNKGKPIIVDEEELKEALAENVINVNEYEIAFETAKNIVDKYNNNMELYYKIIEEYFNKLV